MELRLLSSDAVDRLEAAMLKMPQASSNVRHLFSPGQYIREVTLPADTFAIGHRQKFDHLNIVVKGRVTIVNDDGTNTEVGSGAVFVGKPGRKAGYVHEETVWLNVYATDETDVETLELMFLEKSEAFSEQKLIAHEPDGDFERMLSDLGVTAEQVRSESERTSDCIDWPPGHYWVKVGRSAIDGKGLIATHDIAPGELICRALIGGMRTPAGRFTNHSGSPNAEMRRTGFGDADLYALNYIRGCRGGQDGEEITVDYRNAVTVAALVRS